MSNNLDVALRLYLESRGLESGARRVGQTWNSTTRGMERETLRLRSAFGGLQSQLLKFGVGVGLLQNQRLSGQLDKDLTQIRLTADGTIEQMRSLRRELFSLALGTGQPLDSLKNGFNNLVQAGLSWQQALEATKALNPAMAVTNASAEALSDSLISASANFKFDLSQPGKAVELLDKMRAASKAGAAEMENLASLFPRVAPTAVRSGLGFEDTLGFIEVLSLAEKNPERLGTLSDSTLRAFAIPQYRNQVSRVTGVSFFDKQGNTRPYTDVLTDIIKGAQGFKTQQALSNYLGKVFKGMDQDTVKGFFSLINDPSKIASATQITGKVRSSAGMIAAEVGAATDNPIDQANRMRTVMRQVGDSVAQPLNKAFVDMVQFQMNPREKGGLGLSNTQMAGATIAEIAALGVGGAGLKKLFGNLPVAGPAAELAAGLAQGHLLGESGLATPVFVVNWPGDSNGKGGIGHFIDDLIPVPWRGKGTPRLPGPEPAALPGPVVSPIGRFLAGGAGILSVLGLEESIRDYGTRKWKATSSFMDIGWKNYDDLSDAQRQLVDELGPDAVRQSRGRKSYRGTGAAGGGEMTGTLKIQIGQDGRARVVGMDSSPNFDMSVTTGVLLPGIGQ